MDPVRFSGKEVLEMALRIEENGRRFYKDAAGASRSMGLKDLFNALSREEEEHIKVFTGFKKLIEGPAEPEGYDPYTEEAGLYLAALADSEVFKRSDMGAELASSVKDEREALSVAIGMEKDSILFYYELQKMVGNRDLPVMERLIGQEKEHLRKLTELQRKMK